MHSVGASLKDWIERSSVDHINGIQICIPAAYLCRHFVETIEYN